MADPTQDPGASPEAGADTPVGSPESVQVGGPPAESDEGEFDAQQYGPDAKARDALIHAPLRQEWGGEYEARHAALVGEARAIFTDAEWEHARIAPAQVLESFGRIIRLRYGPKGETLLVRFLDNLATLKKGG